MSSNRLASLAGGIIFLVLAGLCLYRLLYWFPITIGGQQVGQAATFLALAISAALCMVFLRGSRASREG
jgi:high-affinity Fe2+/Pb2+ permease